MLLRVRTTAMAERHQHASEVARLLGGNRPSSIATSMAMARRDRWGIRWCTAPLKTCRRLPINPVKAPRTLINSVILQEAS